MHLLTQANRLEGPPSPSSHSLSSLQTHHTKTPPHINLNLNQNQIQQYLSIPSKQIKFRSKTLKMSITSRKFNPSNLLMVFFVITTIVTPINGLIPRKLDDTTVPTSPDSGIKCGSCSACNNPCNQSPPPPPPPSPPPPPKKPPPKPSQNCPPPPPSSFIYITGPPGNLYPIDPYYSRAGRNFAVGRLPLLIGCGFVGLLFFL